ncbi:MAG: hypothetical protein LBT04_06535, partial [Prevotellaceae bacterium]|nr:hypothetical protein [Prevotellaceae bacterium]
RACYCRTALYDVDEFPNNKRNRYRDMLYESYPEMSDFKKIQEEQEYKNLILKNIVPDPNAAQFFGEYVKPNGNYLTADEREQYINSAKVLNSIRRVWEKSFSRHANSGQKMMPKYQFFQKISALMPSVVSEYRLSFNRFNARRLQDLCDDYKDNNYSVLISGRYGNQNRTKKNRKMIEMIVLSIYGSKDKPFMRDVTKYYNEFVLGQREVFNCDTGEIFDPKDFMYQDEPITISESTVFNIINDPLNRKTVDRLRNDFHYNQQKHNADVERKAPYFSLSKISFDDRDLVRKAICTRENKITGKIDHYEAQVHAYYAFDVASGVCVGSAYSLRKDTNLVMNCMRNMFQNLRVMGLGTPYEAEVENHLMKGTELENKLRETFLEVTYCAPMNSREKRAEHLIDAKKWFGSESEIKRGMSYGRHYAKHEAYLHSREKVFDEKNNTYKNSLQAWEYDRVIAEDQAQMSAWHNEQHPRLKNKNTKEKLYPGMTRLEVLQNKQNTKCTPLNWRHLCHTWGKTTKTSIIRGKSCEVDYRQWWLSDPEVIRRFNPNNTSCIAYYIPNLENLIDEIYLYQDDRYIDKPNYLNAFQEAKAEQTDDDIAIMHKQLGWIQRAKTLVKNHNKDVILGKIGMIKSITLQDAIDEVPLLPPPEYQNYSSIEEDFYTDFEYTNAEDDYAIALSSI